VLNPYPLLASGTDARLYELSVPRDDLRLRDCPSAFALCPLTFTRRFGLDAVLMLVPSDGRARERRGVNVVEDIDVSFIIICFLVQPRAGTVAELGPP
jgi:hypothetical protein